MRGDTMRWLILILTYIGLFAGVQGQITGDYWLEATVDNERPYVGQTISYTVRYYAYNLDRIPDEPIIFPEFEHFWIGNVYEYPPEARIIENVQYYTGEIRFEIVPLVTDAITIPPSELLLIEAAYAPVTSYTSNAVGLDVRPLPDLPPERFTGAVGQYSVMFELDTLDATVGDNLTLKADVVSRMGDLTRVILPDLILGDEWHVTQGAVYPVVQSIFDPALQIRQFEWLLIPLEAGLLTVEGLGFSYFDPVEAEYVELQQNPLQVNVRGQGGLDLQPQLADQLALKTIAKPDQFSYPHGAIWIVPFLIVCLIAGGKQYRADRDQRAITIRKREALARALERVDDLRHHPDEQLNQRTRSIINLYLRDRADPTLKDHLLNPVITTADDLAYKPVVSADERQVFIARFQALLRQIDESRGG